MRFGPILLTLLLVPLVTAQSRRDAELGHRFHTDRARTFTLPMPKEDNTFQFIVYGDRTGGPAEGIAVLDQAVADSNLLDPDLVMTVGDLIQGYNERPEWLAQMHEFKGVMNKLTMPWFPVAGNHDVYWRGKDRPAGEHDQDYETHFGPLWYAFEHKGCFFIALYSDEGNPETGEKNFSKPECQNMSPAQFAWLTGILAKAKDARHVFVFLHHPRWLGGKYGDDWDRVHELLRRAGNVTACFAGHIHRMRYDGKRDGIEYFALATTGGHLSAEIPAAGYLHHFNVVTVRDGGISTATLPVGTVMDPRKITGEISDDIGKLNSELTAKWTKPLVIAGDFSVRSECEVRIQNPIDRSIEVTLTFAADPRFDLLPDHRHLVLKPGEARNVSFQVTRDASPLRGDDLPSLLLSADYLGEGVRIAIPEKRSRVRVLAKDLNPPLVVSNGVLVLDGEEDALIVPNESYTLPDGPFTLEGWCNATSFRERQGFLAKTESSGYGMFVSGGIPDFSVHLDGSYRRAKAKTALSVGAWHHLAGVFDGKEVRLYVDGELVDRAKASGKRTTSLAYPLVIGADPSSRDSGVTSFFPGSIDEVRLSTGARYTGEKFTPVQRFQRDDDTVLLFHLDGLSGAWVYDDSKNGAHASPIGAVKFEAR